MFVEHLRRAVEASPRIELAKVSALLWRAYAAGQVTEDEASSLSDLIEARKAIPAAARPVQRRSGSRPRSPASMERRRRWASSGGMPPQLQARFTLAESAVLAVVAAEVAKKGRCTLTIGHVAALAGVCASTVRNAMRAAQALGFVHVEERPITAWRNAPNRVSITSREWNAWMRMRRRREGTKLCTPRIPNKNEDAAYRPQRAAEREKETSGSTRRGAGWRTP